MGKTSKYEGVYVKDGRAYALVTVGDDLRGAAHDELIAAARRYDRASRPRRHPADRGREVLGALGDEAETLGADAEQSRRICVGRLGSRAAALVGAMTLDMAAPRGEDDVRRDRARHVHQDDPAHQQPRADAAARPCGHRDRAHRRRQGAEQAVPLSFGPKRTNTNTCS